ncbi:MAG: hypothetical protein CL993_01245 [Euryarchaeota archaeon]|nr:hypothetical protein [Euryarchaeota archaeon]|tara:strand:+ start:2547 stop:2972 length:426 start_codon:yes stop_codon:yes gene_type:complete
MSLHRGVWEVYASAVDNVELITDALKWLSGENSKIEIEKEKSVFGSLQTTIRSSMNSKDARFSLNLLSEDSKSALMNNNEIERRIDDDKNFHIRIKLSDLVMGDVKLSDSQEDVIVKGKFKIEAYPGDDTVTKITEIFSGK